MLSQEKKKKRCTFSEEKKGPGDEFLPFRAARGKLRQKRKRCLEKERGLLFEEENKYKNSLRKK